jgi:hypothetical protein
MLTLDIKVTALGKSLTEALSQKWRHDDDWQT